MAGVAAFSGGKGRTGAAAFCAAGEASVGLGGSEWTALSLDSDEAMRAAAEVVLGRADLQELTGLGVPRSKAEQARANIRTSTPCLWPETLASCTPGCQWCCRITPEK